MKIVSESFFAIAAEVFLAAVEVGFQFAEKSEELFG
jgi:hypothetical protein